MAPKPKTSALNVRVTAEEMAYLTGLADDLEITLSEAVRAAIARSILRDISTGERDSDDADIKWLARTAHSVTASPLNDPEAAHSIGTRKARAAAVRPASAAPRR